jgi:hypothetical protein
MPMADDTIRVPKQGALSDLRGWIAGQLGPGVARLYSSNTMYTPDRVPADYIEASFVGYSAIAALNWTVPSTNSDGKGETDSKALTWTFTGGSGTATVYGIYVTDPALGVLLLVIPFLTAVNLTPASPSLSKVIKLTAVSEL